MKYASLLPLSALIAISAISLLVYAQVLPPGSEMLNAINGALEHGVYWVTFVIILLESIVYVGFYFPGQFFAVVLVIGANPRPMDILYLTIAMVCAATMGSFINYCLGRYTSKNSHGDNKSASPTKVSNLLLAMIHINSLAFFMFAQGANKKPIKIVATAGLLNLPYYLLLIFATALLSEQVMQMAENTYLLITVISIWLLAAMFWDFKKYKNEQQKSKQIPVTISD